MTCSAPRKVACPNCRDLFALRRDGTIRVHRLYGHGSPVCAGSELLGTVTEEDLRAAVATLPPIGPPGASEPLP